jgi:signal transduction histidine kinase
VTCRPKLEARHAERTNSDQGTPVPRGIPRIAHFIVALGQSASTKGPFCQSVQVRRARALEAGAPRSWCKELNTMCIRGGDVEAEADFEGASNNNGVRKYPRQMMVNPRSSLNSATGGIRIIHDPEMSKKIVSNEARPDVHLYCLLIALFLLVGGNNINAQDSLLVDPAKIDSLHQLIESHSSADKEKVSLLNEYARLCFYNQEFKEGLIAARDARDLSIKIGFESGITMYQITLAVFSMGRGAINPYHRMIAGMLATKAVDKALLRNPVTPIGYPYPLNEKTLKQIQPAHEYFAALSDKEILTDILFIKGLYYIQNRQPDKGIQFMDQIIALYKDMTMIEPVIVAYNGKIQASLSVNNRSRVDSIFHELTNLLSQVKAENITGITNFQLSTISLSLQHFASAIGYLTKSADFFKETGDLYSLSIVYQQMLTIYMLLEMHSSRADIFEHIIPILNESGDIAGNADWLYQNAVWANYNSKRYDKAREYLSYGIELLKRDSLGLYRQFSLRFFNAQKDHLEGQIQMDLGNYAEAISLLTNTYTIYNNNTVSDRNTRPWAAAHIANCYYQEKEYQSALQYATLCYNTANPTTDLRLGLKVNLQLADIYEVLGKKDSAYKYLRKYQDLLIASRKLENTRQIFELQISSIVRDSEEQISQLEQESLLKEQKNKNQQLWIFSITGALLSALLIALILYRNNKNKQKTNNILEKTLSNLKSTQSQLRQSEKMASLGELTAGIAHEIQNPLNFVSNFSEVNHELLAEMNAEIEKENYPEAKAIAKNVFDNEEKIIHHSKRADAIVKGMLQHSRTSSGQKELTDINILCDEYLRLSYHGLRAKDKNFTAKFETHFDESIPKINVVPQDIGRVVLNLINNAFYAVNEKSKVDGAAFNPSIAVSTKNLGGKIEIVVKDNGNGIPDSIREKIFQPFFTTKPTGQGTGLGLSLSYDIVKAHGGELRVTTRTSEGSEFLVSLPV